jgi:internalin A
LGKVTTFDLRLTKITDAGVMVVAKLKKLTYLSLAYTKITDAGLKEVAKMQQLEKVNLYGNPNLTKPGVAELKKALPNCFITGL